MANTDSKNSFNEEIRDLERLVAVWENHGHSCTNFESITDLITQKLVGLDALGDNDIHGTSLKDLGRLVGIRNTIFQLNICTTRNYGEYWGILDAFKEDGHRSLRSEPCGRNVRSSLPKDVRGMGRARLPDDEVSYSVFSIRQLARLCRLHGAECPVGGVQEGTRSRRRCQVNEVLKLAAKLRDTLPPQFHIWIDKIVAQKLRILSIRQAGKSDVSGHHIRSYYVAAHNGKSLR
ncbi:hypothetical protein HO173_002034 [Letharia columbiana]|uniref:Uncharacterized protein n=1 Tax=Letharia columbiana TaxID=112416 RepID=A0A8H6G2W4_9LECA|nr:uncharacterized protein HO173_002034 [Letharia columbiana]KAF6239490.1 hypothetical protein HO173_002034 [Letharia columbiana]